MRLLSFTDGKLCILHGLLCGNECELAEAFNTGQLYLVEVFCWIEILYWRADVDGEFFKKIELQLLDA